MDLNIETWLKLQDLRLKELAKTDPLEKVESEVFEAKWTNFHTSHDELIDKIEYFQFNWVSLSLY